MARQSPLPDTQDSLAKQRADFNQFATRVTEKALFFNGVIDKTKEFSSNPKNETSRLKTDLINYSNEAAYRLKMVYIAFVIVIQQIEVHFTEIYFIKNEK